MNRPSSKRHYLVENVASQMSGDVYHLTHKVVSPENIPVFVRSPTQNFYNEMSSRFWVLTDNIDSTLILYVKS